MKKLALVALLAVILVPSFALGQSFDPPGRPGDASSLSTVQDVWDMIGNVANWILSFLVALSVIFVLYAAFLYLTAAGDAAKVSKANQTLLYAAIAVAVGFLAWVIPNVAKNFVQNI